MQFANINGINIHYQVIAAADDKPTLVFANSLGSDFRIWRDVIVRLVGDCSIVMYDMRGHGLSDATKPPYIIDDHANDLAGLMDHLGISKAVICGLSIGGVVAQGVTFLRPDLVAGLVLCCTGMKIGGPTTWSDRIEAVQTRGLAAMAQEITGKWFTPAYVQAHPADMACWSNLVGRQPADGYLGSCAALRDADLSNAATLIAVPTICIAADGDGATPPDVMLAAAKAIPDARYELIKDCGHIAPVEKPEMVAEIIKAFLKDANLA